VVATGVSLLVSVGFAEGGAVGRSTFRVDGVGTVDFDARGGVRPGCAGGAIDVAGTALGSGELGAVVPIVDSPGSAGCTGSGGPAR
jgi:hypothetical protein